MDKGVSGRDVPAGGVCQEGVCQGGVCQGGVCKGGVCQWEGCFTGRGSNQTSNKKSTLKGQFSPTSTSDGVYPQ